MKHLLLLILLASTRLSFSQEETAILKTPTGNIEGSLLFPAQKTPVPLVIIIAGSGPTDRNGNNEIMENNSLKMLAEAFRKSGIASLRYDKRGIGKSSDVSNKSERDMRPETFANDVKDWIDHYAKDKRFSKIIVAGHSEGALMGLLASVNNPKVNGYISIAGAGRPIDEILKEQFSSVPDNVKEIIYGMLDKLKKGDTISNVPPILYSVFRPAIQPYMISWMKIDPRREISKLTVPALIINGTTDIQVKETDARQLAEALPGAKLLIIKNMNHILKDCDTLDKTIQVETYNNPTLPLNTGLAKAVTDFVKELSLPATPVKKD